MFQRIFLLAIGVIAAYPIFAAPISGYIQTNLVSDVPNLAANTDPNLKNPWGIATSASSPFWVANQVTSKSTLYNTAGTPQGLIVSVANSPTGVVFNGDASAFNGDVFIFATLGGIISGWRGALGTNAENLFLGNGVYTGLAVATVSGNTYLLAADNQNNEIDVFKGQNAPDLPGKFVDPNLPAGFTVYNIQIFGAIVYITYENTTGSGGIVTKFSTDGNLLGRLITNNGLDAPWGLAFAPANWGPASGALLVGNEDQGTINAYDPTTGREWQSAGEYRAVGAEVRQRRQWREGEHAVFRGGNQR